MTPDIEALVARLDELRAKATPGPWVAALGSGANVMTAISGDRRGEVEFVADCLPDWALDNCAVAPDHRDNLNLIVAAVNALPDLLAALRSQAARIAEMKRDMVALQELARVMSCIHTMTDEQLAELMSNAIAARSAKP